MTTATNDGVCDFCSEPHPNWIYPADNFVVHKYEWGSDAGWAACEECSQLIEEEHYESLLQERMMSIAIREFGPLWQTLNKSERRRVEDDTRRLLNKFRHARKGARLLATP